MSGAVSRPRWALLAPPRLQLALATLALALVYADFIWRASFVAGGLRYFTLFDDAMISMRYARHLAAGLGLSWNPGDVPPVEGYSNFLWVCLMALVHAAGTPANLAAGAVSVVAALLLLCNLHLVYRITREVAGAHGWALLAALLAASYYPTVYWSLRGMEVALLDFFLLSGVWAALRLLGAPPPLARREAALLLLLSQTGLLLTRDETALLVLPGLALLAASRDAGGASLKAGMIRIGVFAVALKLAHLAWRHGYYGEWVPNTYYLKLHGSRLASRLQTAMGDLQPIFYSLAPVIACACFAAGAARNAAARRLVRLLQLLVTSYAAYTIYVGEDAWLIDFSNRYFATLAPLLWILCVLGVKALADAPVSRARGALLLGFLAAQALLLWRAGGFPPWPLSWLHGMLAASAVLMALLLLRSRIPASVRGALLFPGLLALLLAATSAPAWRHAWDFAPMFVVDDESYAKQGLFLRRTLARDTRVATAWLGAPAYFSDLYFIDLEGKVDRVVARMQGVEPFRAGFTKKDPAYSIGQLKPAVVLYKSPDWGCYGYVSLSNGLCVRPDLAPRLQALDASWCDEHDRSMYCP